MALISLLFTYMIQIKLCASTYPFYLESRYLDYSNSEQKNLDNVVELNSLWIKKKNKKQKTKNKRCVHFTLKTNTDYFVRCILERSRSRSNILNENKVNLIDLVSTVQLIPIATRFKNQNKRFVLYALKTNSCTAN